MPEQYDYLVVRFVGELKRSMLSTESATNLSQQLQNLINGRASQGWQLYCLDEVGI